MEDTSNGATIRKRRTERRGKKNHPLRSKIPRLKQTSKSLANLARKFDRFDDRITVQTRDQDQRLRKLERKRGA
jgi:hypothetical protein